MLKKISFLAALVVLSQASASQYGMAGCGLGALAFQDQPGKIQIVAATVNNLISPQTFAISSGTSGCYDDGSASAKINYIDTNIVALKVDAARGQGETLDGLVTLLGCSEAGAVKSEIKNNYKTIFSQSTSIEILNAIKANQTVGQSCGSLG